RATILIAQNELSEADDLLTGDPEPSDRPQQIHMRYLRAQLTARNDKEKAIPLFRTIVEDPNPVPSLLRHSAWVSLAGCLHETGKSEDAIETLITLLDTHPRTALLEATFHRLLDWASTESLRKRVENQLLTWVSFSPPGDTPPEPGGGEIIVSPATATRTGFALYYHSLSLARKNDTESNKRAESLLAWLGANMPRHPFCSRALLETAKLQIAGQRKEEAILTLAQLEKSASSARLREEAGRLAARLNFEKGDFASAADAFLRVRSSLPPPEEDVNAINAGISLLRAGDGTGFKNLVESLDASETRATLLLERALHQVARESGDARPSLERFLRDNPEHPRAPEARLAIAEECLRLEPSSASAHRQIMAELSSLQAIPLSFQLDLRRLLVHLRAASLTSKWDPAITASRELLRKHKPNRMSTPVRLKLAEAYYHNGNLSDAQARFQEIAAAAADPVIAETALYYAARAALKLNAGNSDQEAENLLRQVIDGGGSLATDARLLLAYSQIDGQPRETISNLQILL
ncbi:MAG: tetratricopeptide repeat protein, partial [Verrucomicrobiota bacterium]|nr:tetratricopeptide repeat protein [Verrucomicrobiota bacterium]